MDLLQWSDYLWESEEKELMNEKLKIEKAEREISDDEIESKFKDKKKEKKFKKKQEKKRNKKAYIIDNNISFQQVWMDILHSG